MPGVGASVTRALQAYVAEAARGGDHRGSVRAAAEAVSGDPWAVVEEAGALARGRMEIAPTDLALTDALTAVDPGHRRAVLFIEEGQPYPAFDLRGRRKRGAFDTPAVMARRVVAATVDACQRPPSSALDPACGTGAFLVALTEAGIREVWGSDLDPVALEVARVAAPGARLERRDAFLVGATADMICGNPPFVPPERQDKALRARLRTRFPWLRGRFDLVIPFCAAAAERVAPGGGLGLVVPGSTLVQPYGAPLRRAWLLEHRVVQMSEPGPFPGASVEVVELVCQIGTGPASIPAHGLQPDELLKLDNAPWNPKLHPGDIDWVQRVRRRSVALGDLALVDTGVVAHGPDGGKERLLYDEPGPGRVPFADAKEFFAGRHRWLDYDPPRMHRAKSPDMFEVPKLVIQRIRGKGPVRAAVDRQGLYMGHTCTVVVPKEGCPPLDALAKWVRSPIVEAITRVERGQRLDFYPRDVASIPIPRGWKEGRDETPTGALGLSADELERVQRLVAG